MIFHAQHVNMMLYNAKNVLIYIRETKRINAVAYQVTMIFLQLVQTNLYVKVIS